MPSEQTPDYPFPPPSHHSNPSEQGLFSVPQLLFQQLQLVLGKGGLAPAVSSNENTARARRATSAHSAGPCADPISKDVAIHPTGAEAAPFNGAGALPDRNARLPSPLH